MVYSKSSFYIFHCTWNIFLCDNLYCLAQTQQLVKHCNWWICRKLCINGRLVFVWTPSHFWCLAMKIRDDYAEAKVPMLPVLIGMQKTSKYILLNTAILVPYSVMLVAFGLGYVYLAVALVSGGLMLVYHYKLTKTPTSDFAWKAYKVTAPYLTIIFVGIALDAAFHFPVIK